MGAKVTALAALAAYYVPVISLGTWRSDRRGRSRKKLPGPHRDGNGEAAKADGNYSISLRLFLANREVPLLLALCSMTAAWGGGGYLCGTAEAVFKNGLLSVQAPLGYAISLLLGGRFFSHKMRSTRSVTMLDPLQQLYGRWMGPLLCVPALFGELFWTAAALAALGDSAEVIGDLNGTACIVACLLLTMSYTTMGGLNSVVQTDAVQLCATIIGLWICVPFCITNDASGIIDVSETTANRLTFPDVTQLVDNFLSFVCGGIPRQVYFQRVLSSSSLFNAKMFSYISAIGCLLLAVPPIIIGTVSRTASKDSHTRI
ncbi:hypothetical protein HPB48_017943 [Haemaphysalis longicornis]|uniref:Uncharacterized protein n=1 Tax=Haemaphysalis longicornis TaxID=44386 RepID=A0A9J6GNW5_HAELO|nr:hypothetical protein HPB48_017943 [Haemaphysalis longicornis]